MTSSFHFNLFCIFVCLLQSLPSIHLAQKAPFTGWGMLQETDSNCGRLFKFFLPLFKCYRGTKGFTGLRIIHTYLIDHSPLGLFRPMKQTTKMNLTARLRIPTGRRQTSWLCTSAATELNQGLPRTNPASDQSGTWTRDLQISSPALSPLGHAASLIPVQHPFQRKQKYVLSYVGGKPASKQVLYMVKSMKNTIQWKKRKQTKKPKEESLSGRACSGLQLTVNGICQTYLFERLIEK